MATTTSIRAEDRHIGQRIRRRRKMLGLTQTQVAQRIGVQFQQLQKYETGMNRVSGSRLCDLSKALMVQPSYFFEGIGEHFRHDAPQTALESSIIGHMRKMPTPAASVLLDVAVALAEHHKPQDVEMAG